jgi:Cytidylate kinase-like family
VSLKPRKLIALSASYGAGGDVVGQALAERLGVPLLDRAIPIKVAEQLRVDPAEAVTVEVDSPGWLERMMRGFATGGTGLQIMLPPGAYLTREDFRRETEKLLNAQCESGGGVMVGRAAAVFLRQHPGVLRVRLDGPREARLRQAMAIGDVDEETASETLDRLDQTQAAYSRELYGADLADPSHYHLVIDSTAVDLDTCLTLILTAAGVPAGDDAAP